MTTEKKTKIIDVDCGWAGASAPRRRPASAGRRGAQGRSRPIPAGRRRWVNGEGRAYTIRRPGPGRAATARTSESREGHRVALQAHLRLAYFLAERAGLVAPPRPTDTSPRGGLRSQPEPPQPQPPAQAEPQAAPTGEGLKDPVVPWGKRKGQRLSQIAQEDPEYLFFLARRMEPRSDEDRVLQEAARTLLADLVAEAVERAFADPAAMPVLPFGEEKGTPLTKCHPKWVAVLAKKGTEDARSFQDLVLYEVARRIQAQRQAKKRQARASLDAEVFLRAVQEVARETAREAVREAVLAALEAVREREADQEAILTDLADLRRRVERLERALGALRHAAEREALLAAR
jgi:hypothetical protein